MKTPVEFLEFYLTGKQYEWLQEDERNTIFIAEAMEAYKNQELNEADAERITMWMSPKDWNLFQWVYAYVLFTVVAAGLCIGIINFFDWVFSMNCK